MHKIFFNNNFSEFWFNDYQFSLKSYIVCIVPYSRNLLHCFLSKIGRFLHKTHTKNIII